MESTSSFFTYSLLLLALVSHHQGLVLGQECSAVSVTNEWPDGYQATLQIPFDHEVHGWEMIMGFDSALDTFMVGQAPLKQSTYGEM